MGSALSREVAALETTEKVIAALVLADERDAVIQRLIRAIEDDRALILAKLIGDQAVRRS
jgi:hypothetical protein